jgi:hypothetical protein
VSKEIGYAARPGSDRSAANVAQAQRRRLAFLFEQQAKIGAHTLLQGSL